METWTLAALCALGAEKICANEIRKLNADSSGGPAFAVLESGWGRVTFSTTTEGIYYALCALRSADRVLLRCARWPAEDFDALFEGAAAAELEQFLPRQASVRIGKVRSKGSLLKAETSIQAVVHKAAAQRLCTAWGLQRLPEADAAGSFELRVYVEKNYAELLLDLSGEPLFKRGYRAREPGGGSFAGGNGGSISAPLRETSAAALVLASQWKRKYPLCDPFCGSGTIAIEAALYACNLAPNAHRRFALDRLTLADAGILARVRAELQSRACVDAPFFIRASDSDGALVQAARRCWEQACRAYGLDVDLPVRVNTLAMDEAKSYTDTPGFIITNPPWGRRLGTPQEAEENYRRMAGLCTRFWGWKIVVLSDHSGFESFFGRRADSCTQLTGGAAQTYIYQFNVHQNQHHQNQYHKAASPAPKNPQRPPQYQRRQPDEEAAANAGAQPLPKKSVKQRKSYTW